MWFQGNANWNGFPDACNTNEVNWKNALKYKKRELYPFIWNSVERLCCYEQQSFSIFQVYCSTDYWYFFLIDFEFLNTNYETFQYFHCPYSCINYYHYCRDYGSQLHYTANNSGFIRQYHLCPAYHLAGATKNSLWFFHANASGIHFLC